MVEIFYSKICWSWVAAVLKNYLNLSLILEERNSCQGIVFCCLSGDIFLVFPLVLTNQTNRGRCNDKIDTQNWN